MGSSFPHSLLSTVGQWWANLQPFCSSSWLVMVFSGRLAILSLVFVLQSSESPQPGDLIEIFRLDYKHWAVYVGDGYVVHLLNSGEHDLLTHQLVIDNCEQKHHSLLDLLASVPQSFYSVQNGKCTSPVESSLEF